MNNIFVVAFFICLFWDFPIKLFFLDSIWIECLIFYKSFYLGQILSKHKIRFLSRIFSPFFVFIIVNPFSFFPFLLLFFLVLLFFFNSYFHHFHHSQLGSAPQGDQGLQNMMLVQACHKQIILIFSSIPVIFEWFFMIIVFFFNQWVLSAIRSLIIF